ncbi:MAG TPA: hypothetical protein PK349_13435 [Candidatus Hydrogenedentes bacterium]|nr:hypothetical protein [Candidatus Hydrogenedentota bacterium]
MTDASRATNRGKRAWIRWIARVAGVGLITGLVIAGALPLWLPVVSGALTPVRVEADGPLWNRPLGLTFSLGPLHGRARIVVSEVYPEIRLERARLEPEEGGGVVVEAESVSLAYAWPWRERPVRTLRIGALRVDAVRLGAWIREASSNAPGAVQPSSGGNGWAGALETLCRRLPGTVWIGSMRITSHTPAGPVTVEGGPVEARTRALPASWSVEISARADSGMVRWAEGSFSVTADTTLRLEGTRTGGRCAAALRVGPSEESSLSGSVDATWDEQGVSRVDLRLDRGTLEGLAWTLLCRGLTGDRLAWDSLALASGQVAVTRRETGAWLVTATGSARATGLRLGREDAPWYRGNLDVACALDGDGVFTTRLDAGGAGQLEARWTATDKGNALTLDLSGWRPVALREQMPWLAPWLSPWETWLPERLDARLEGAIGGIGGLPGPTSVDGWLSGGWPAPGGSARWAIQSTTDRDGLQVRLREASVGESLDIVAHGFPHAWHGITARAAGVDLARWLRLTRGWDMLDDLKGTWSGMVEVAPGPEIRWEITAEPETRWQGRPLGQPGQVRAAGRVYRDSGRWLVTGEGQLSGKTRLRVENAEWLGGSRLRGRWRIPTADVAELAGPLGLEGAWGEVTMHGSGRFTFEYGLLIWESDAITSTALGWGAYFLPPDWTLSARARGSLRWGGPEGWSARLEQARVEADRTALDLGGLEARAGGLEVSDLALRSDMAPLVRWGWLSEAQGGDASLRVPAWWWPWDTDAWHGTIEYQVTADRLSFWHGRIALERPRWVGRLAREAGGQFTGDGDMSIAAARMAGGTLTSIGGRMTASGEQISVEDLSASGWNGSLGGRVEVSPLDTGMPARGTIRLRGIDLGRFCAEVNPPYVRCEGELNGWTRFALSAFQPTDFRFRATAGNGFSVNTDFVRQLLMSSKVTDYAGGRQAAGVVLDVLGSKPQRPFDGGAVDIRLAEERLAGALTLSSRDLNLTVDIKADPMALLDALEANGGAP